MRPSCQCTGHKQSVMVALKTFQINYCILFCKFKVCFNAHEHLQYFALFDKKTFLRSQWFENNMTKLNLRQTSKKSLFSFNQHNTCCLKLKKCDKGQGKLNIVTGRISTVGPEEYLGF